MKFALLNVTVTINSYDTYDHLLVVIPSQELETVSVNERIFDTWMSCDQEPNFYIDNPHNGYTFYEGAVSVSLDSITYLSEADYDLLMKYI